VEIEGEGRGLKLDSFVTNPVSLDFHVFVVFSIENHGLSGTLPVDLSLLPSLRTLDLSRNQLAGPIPSQYATSLLQLEVLLLTENKLRGETSLNFFDLVTDRILDINLRNNTLTGTLSTHIGRLTNLQRLWIGENNYEGTMPTEIGNMIALETLDMDGNEFTGTLPTELGLLTNAVYVSCSAEFSGTIPTELAQMTSLEILFLQKNELAGPIPDDIYNMTQLQRLQLQENKLTGTLSTLVGQLANLNDLRVSRNELTGSIPSEIQNLSNLILAWFNLNQFTGSVPSEICSLRTTTLEFLNADCYPVLGEVPNPCLEGCCTSCCERETEFCKEF
jgi:Leucine-rich repeat (LRR) protein